LLHIRFAEFLPLIYPPELEVKETTDTASSASFLGLYLEFDDSGQLSTKLRDVNTICRRSWYIAAHIWKIYDFKIEVVPFIINFSTELTTVVKFEVSKYVQQYTSFSCIWCLHLAIDSLCKGVAIILIS
jgi:hypothetical protein